MKIIVVTCIISHIQYYQPVGRAYTHQSVREDKAAWGWMSRALYYFDLTAQLNGSAATQCFHKSSVL